ncbi:hypothetical protein BURPS406E_Q0009 [Burkholderia pseudomallei 406e]|nr:hypothetical protein BURPS668_A3293 [Burkholderia pseudomallei 668]EDO88978.1 hypothetical protein BURPS406E_Q0009 [Burkholderia pseudomallei 406e]EDO95406.1 hypothetical protein BURPSPAST_X0109 [Burkholderia pseudomallei Pasteur 52237]EEC33825.1 conserved hypothetical protein [Burkholderia pseudomallei 576]
MWARSLTLLNGNRTGPMQGARVRIRSTAERGAAVLEPA